MRLIDADALINKIKSDLSYKDYEWSMYADGFIEDIDSAPTIEAVYICNRKRCDKCSPECDFTRDINYAGTTDKVFVIDNAPTIDAVSVVHGKWEEKETFHNADDNPIIEEWQSARCSMCGKYHTTPYMYYFDNYNFCPNCGADMREREGE